MSGRGAADLEVRAPLAIKGFKLLLCLSEAFELDGVGLEGVPLADDEVAVFEDADVVAVVEDGFVAVQGDEFAVFVNGLGAAGGRDDFACGVEDDGEAGGIAGELVVDGVFGPANAGVEFLAGDDGAADHAAGDGQGLDVFAVEAEALETVVGAGGDEDGGFVAALAKVYSDAVGVVQALLDGDAVFAAEFADELAFGVILQDELGAVTVGDVDVAIGGDGGFGGVKELVGLVSADGHGVADGEDLFAVEADLGDATGLAVAAGTGLPEAGVGDEEEFLAILVGIRETVTAGPSGAPGVEDGAIRFEDEELVVGVIADHEESAVLHLDHLVAVEDGVVAALAGGDPVFDDSVAVAAVADDSVFGGVRGGAQALGPGGGSSGGETMEEVAAGRHKTFVRGCVFGVSWVK